MRRTQTEFDLGAVWICGLFQRRHPELGAVQPETDLAGELSWTCCRSARDPSLRLKNGCGQGDVERRTRTANQSSLSLHVSKLGRDFSVVHLEDVKTAH